MTDHPDLLRTLANESLHDDGNDGRTYVFLEDVFDIPGEFRGGSACRLQIFNQRRRYFAVGTHLYARGQVCMVPDKDLQ